MKLSINKIASMACRSAVKANDYLNMNEMDKLIEDLRYINDPFPLSSWKTYHNKIY